MSAAADAVEGPAVRNFRLFDDLSYHPSSVAAEETPRAPKDLQKITRPGATIKTISPGSEGRHATDLHPIPNSNRVRKNTPPANRVKSQIAACLQAIQHEPEEKTQKFFMGYFSPYLRF